MREHVLSMLPLLEALPAEAHAALAALPTPGWVFRAPLPHEPPGHGWNVALHDRFPAEWLESPRGKREGLRLLWLPCDPTAITRLASLSLCGVNRDRPWEHGLWEEEQDWDEGTARFWVALVCVDINGSPGRDWWKARGTTPHEAALRVLNMILPEWGSLLPTDREPSAEHEEAP
jgi:hypothetical protein